MEIMTQIKTREQFVKFVSELVQSFAKERGSWKNADIRSYLKALAFLLENNTEKLRTPSWGYFAQTLLCAKQHQYSSLKYIIKNLLRLKISIKKKAKDDVKNIVFNEPEFTKKVKTKIDLIEFIYMLLKDHSKNEWDNNNLTSFLEGMANFTDDIEGFYHNFNIPFSENPNWKMFANILAAARVYE